MKPLRMTVHLHNNQLRARREALGLNQGEFAEKLAINESDYGSLENLRKKPMRKDGSWRKLPTLLAKFYHVMEEDLFPEIVLAVQQSTVERELDEREVLALLPDHMRRAALGPEVTHLAIEQKALLENNIAYALSTLTPREARIVRERFGLTGSDEAGKTLRALGTVEGLTCERIRGIESKALQKLRHPSRSRELRMLWKGPA